MGAAHAQDTIDDVLALMAQGLTNTAIASYYPAIPVNTIKRWRREKFAPVAAQIVTKAVTKTAMQTNVLPKLPPIPTIEEMDAQPTERIVLSGQVISDSEADAIEQINHALAIPEELDDVTELGILIGRNLRANLKALTRMAQIVSEPSFLRGASNAGDIARLMDVMGDQTVRIIEAAKRHHNSTPDAT